MADIAHILLVPNDEHLHLIRDDPDSPAFAAGWHPPLAFEWQCPEHGRRWMLQRERAWVAEHSSHNVSTSRSGCRTGLVLAWAGDTLVQGVDWATRCQTRTRRDGGVEGCVRRLLHRPTSVVGASLGSLGTVILLDANGNEVVP